MTESEVIELLSRYQQMQARIKVLSTYDVGAGITISRLNTEDHLQDLHRKLRHLPSYMYLSKREQQLETIAHAYLTRYPAGVLAQKKAIPLEGANEEDEKLLRELRGKIQKVIEARGYGVRTDYDAILERLSELQDLQAEIQRIDETLEAVATYKPEFAKLLRLYYIEGKTEEETAEALYVTDRTIRRWKAAAIREFIKMSA